MPTIEQIRHAEEQRRYRAKDPEAYNAHRRVIDAARRASGALVVRLNDTNRIFDLIMEKSTPADAVYTKAMARIYDLQPEIEKAHKEMFEAYEDGLNEKAEHCARIVAMLEYELADLHTDLATAFYDLSLNEDGQVASADRHASNREAGEPRDSWIDECEHGNPGKLKNGTIRCAKCAPRRVDG